MYYILNTILPLIISLLIIIAILSVIIRAIIQKTKNRNTSILGSIGKLIGNSSLNFCLKMLWGHLQMDTLLNRIFHTIKKKALMII